MAKAGLTGNCLLDHSNANSPDFGIKRILGMNTVLSDPGNLQIKTLLSIVDSKISFVPLHSPSFIVNKIKST